MATIEQEIWDKDIQENLFMSQDFIKFSKDYSAFVNKKTVHLPQAGNVPGIEKNRSVLPALIGTRTDTLKSFDLSEFTVDPTTIPDIEELQISYAKRENVMRDIYNSLNERIGNEVAYSWATNNGLISASGQIIKTTGTATVNIAPPSGTGNRNAVKLTDIAAIAKKMDKDNVSTNGRYLLLPSDMYWNMIDENDTKLINADYMNKGNLPNGIVNTIYNINILVRPSVVVYTSANVLKAVGAAGASGDLYGGIAWHSSSVCNALGTVETYLELKRAEYYGSVFSARVMHGSTILRDDFKGVCTLVQSA